VVLLRKNEMSPARIFGYCGATERERVEAVEQAELETDVVVLPESVSLFLSDGERFSSVCFVRRRWEHTSNYDQLGRH